MFKSTIPLSLVFAIASFHYFNMVQSAQLVYRSPRPTGNQNKIINGTLASLNQFPFQISIQINPNGDSYDHLCGGTIISETCILTAAHCTLDQRINSTVIVAGSLNLDDSCKRPIHSISIHPKYQDATNINDISIIKLSDPLVFSSSIQPIPLPTVPNVTTPVGSLATTMGWGVTTVDGDLSSALLYVEVPIVSDQGCAEDYIGIDGVTVVESTVCAGTGFKDSCQGDSGGPLIVDGIQIGIVSTGEGCADPRYPGIYTEISYFLDYLQNEGCI